MRIYKCSANKFARFYRVLVITSQSWKTAKPTMKLRRHPKKLWWKATNGIASTQTRGFRSGNIPAK